MFERVSSAQPVYLVKGDDPALLSQALSGLISELVGDRPIDLTLEDLPEESDMSVVMDAVQTPSFLTDRRVVLVRGAGRFRADEVEPLIAYLASPMETTSLVLVAGGGATNTRLSKAVKDKGHVVDASVPMGKGRQIWVTDALKKGPVKLDREATSLITNHLGEELGQLSGILDALAAAYGEGATISADQLEPFLGAGGSAAPWELTDAIDSGNTVTALAQLRRMLEGGQRHPLVIMATLRRHVSGLMKMDGSDVTSEAQAAAVLGMAPYPAKKVMNQAKKLGSKPISRAIGLVSQADIDLRGGSAWSADLVLEVLVARLSKLSPRVTTTSSVTRRNVR